MKQFRQLVKELPSKKIVFALGKFQPPSAGHEHMINAVKKIASTQKADHVIYTSNNCDKKNNPLSVDRKLYYLQRMFPGMNFSEETKTLDEAVQQLSKKYKEIILVVGADRFSESKKICEKYNVEVVSLGERDVDSDAISSFGVKILESAKKNDFLAFKKGMPYTLTELDSKRLMNEVRQGLGLDTVKQFVKFETNELREKYFAGEIFHVGSIVECAGQVLKIIKRGSNHLLLQTEEGNLVSKWPQDLAETDKEFKEKESDMAMKFSQFVKCPQEEPETKQTESDLDAECAKQTHNKVGHTYGHNSETHRRMKVHYKLGEEVEEESVEITDKEIDDMIDNMTEDDYLEAYHDDELSIVDKETGEALSEVQEEIISEVLSKPERIRAKMRFARSAANRERKIRIALKTRSNTTTLNKRARRLAIVLMKKRLAKKPLSSLSVGEKERLETIIAKRKKIIDRIAMRLVPRIKRIENERLSHKHFTK